MTGLVYKDFLTMRKVFMSYAVIMVFYAVLACFNILSFGFIITFVNVMLMVMPLSTFAVDDQAKWDRYAMSLPLGRRAVVKARYIFVFVLSLVTSALGLSGSAALWIFQAANVTEMLLTLAVSAALGLLVSAVLLPVCYKVGVQQARIVLYAILFTPFLAMLLLVKAKILDLSILNELDSLSPGALLAGMTLLPLGGLAALLVSCLVSCHIVDNKEY